MKRRRRNPGNVRSNLTKGAEIGGVAALTIFVVDSVLSQVPSLNSSTFVRSVSRLAIGGGLAYASSKMKSVPEYVPQGLVGGVVAMTALDVGTSLIGQQRPANPPTLPANAALALGEPWAPRLFV